MKLFHHKKISFTSIVLFITAFAVSFSAWAAHTVDLKVIGVKGVKAIENVEIYTSMIDKEESDGSERHKYLVREAINKALQVYGYYTIKINFSLKPSSGKTRPTLVADVNAGRQTLIEGVDVRLLGEAVNDEAFVALNDKKLAKKGDMLYHSYYEDYKSSLQSLAQARGYFNADFELSRLEVMPSTYQAWWRIIFNSGQRYHFGKFSFLYSQIREDYLRNIMQIKEKDPYFINDLSLLTNDYTSSGWFKSVLLRPHINEEKKQVDVDVLLYPRKKNAMDIGVGYSSDVGPRLQLGWLKPWINSRGQSFSTNLYLSSPKQMLGAVYKIPLLKNPLRYYYEFSGGFERERENDTDTLSATFVALRYWNRVTGWQHSLGVRVRYDSFLQGDVSDKTVLIYPTASVSRTRLKGGAFPTWGDSQHITVDISHKNFLSDASFFKIQASTAWVRTFAENHRTLARAEIGLLKTNDIDKIPPALRFFAGGDRSVRGYGYKKISPKDSKGNLIGASRLLNSTLEYQYRVYDDWWLATFADIGLADNSFNVNSLHYGAGMGVRWASPVGAIKLDIATPIRDKEKSKNIQFYIGIGTEL